MRRFVEGVDRGQTTLFPECLKDWIGEDNPARVVDVFVEGLDLAELGFGGVDPEATGRPSYHPSILLKLYIYGYLNRVQLRRNNIHSKLRNNRSRSKHGDRLSAAATKPISARCSECRSRKTLMPSFHRR
jgi:hypothetical protein